MDYMFYSSIKLKEIKGIYNFNTFNTTKMNLMFNECFELDFLDLSNFDTSNVINMEGMFSECHKLKEIKGINKLRTSNVRQM